MQRCMRRTGKISGMPPRQRRTGCGQERSAGNMRKNCGMWRNAALNLIFQGGSCPEPHRAHPESLRGGTGILVEEVSGERSSAAEGYGEWYAAFLAVPRLKLGESSRERVEVLNLRVCPGESGGLVDHRSRFPAYHMNKKNWVSFCLDGTVPFEELAARLETSRRLAGK